MDSPLRSFASLYSTTFLMVLAAGLLTTYLGLSLTNMNVPQIWIGGMMSAYYVGLVCGSKVGHKLIAQVGHIRAFVACAGIVTASALGHALIDNLTVWLILRLAVGMGMMCQYMVLESWLNEQAETNQRGTVFASYMIVSYLGLMAGQGAISLYPDLGIEPLLLIAICFALCIVPISITRRIHPEPLTPAPLKMGHFWQRAPQALSTIALGSMIVGCFYGLAPSYATSKGIDPEHVAMYMSCTIFAGLLAQWPMGKLSDIISRSLLIRINCGLLGVLVLIITIVPFHSVYSLILTSLFGILAFTLYPLATALANSRVEQHERVGLSATILVTFGIGASIGPLLASGLMQVLGDQMLYGFMAICSFTLLARLMWVNLRQKAEQHSTGDYVMAGGDLVSSPLAASLDPRVNIEMVNEQMIYPADDAFDRLDDIIDDEQDDAEDQPDYNAAYANTMDDENDHIDKEDIDDEDVDNEMSRR
ncbi:MFS transporter [Shewanella ulleungensis]|jgi:MFS family permease|uniref:MFS transporter n=1 Tax=Shewanella ulleungensis TaxID=2282699 RepID=A0ABQ2QG69_9GAMM|nr:MFS transporter [Shewanella ulleungensis]MCL1149276.1 MFS transporter [Shewanella ulleungensis]GGP78043.1 MFS transporter [Shewanella ulleungensis]